MKLRRFLSVALCVLMLGSLLPVSVLAEGGTEAPVSYDLWVNGVSVTSANADDVLGDGTVRYDALGNILQLTNATLSQTYSAAEGACAIYYSGNTELHITALGKNTVNTINNGTGDGGTNSTAIYAGGDLRLNGTGYLRAHGTAAIKAVGKVTIGRELHLVAEAASGLPIEAGSIEYPSEGDKYNSWRTAKTTLRFEETAPTFNGSYFEMLGETHAMEARVFEDNGDGTHKISCGKCGAVLGASALHRGSTTLCDCGIALAVVSASSNVEGRSYHLLQTALANANDTEKYIHLFSVAGPGPVTMALSTDAEVKSGTELRLGNGRSSGNNIAVGENVTLTFAEGSSAYLLNNGITLGSGSKAVDMGGNFYYWANSQPTGPHSHQEAEKSWINNGDGTHSATVDCGECKLVYHVPVDENKAMSAPHSYGEGGLCVCGEQAEASYTVAEGIQYGTLQEAFGGVNEGGRITVLKNAVLTSAVSSKTSAELDLNGCSVTYGGVEPAPGALLTVESSELTITDSKGSGKIEHAGNAVKILTSGGAVTQMGGGIVSTGGDAVVVEGNGMYALKNGEVQAPSGTAIVSSGVQVHFYGGRISGQYGVHIKDGKSCRLFADLPIEGDIADFKFEADGKVGVRAESGLEGVYTVVTVPVPTDVAPVKFAEKASTSSLPIVTFVPDPKNFASASDGFFVGRAEEDALALYAGTCSHENAGENGCPLCGEPAVAKVTTGTETVYYMTMSKALSQWSQQTEQTTLTLLHDGVYDSTSPLGLSGNHILDLNGCTLTMTGQGTIQLDTNAELRMKDSSDAQDGLYKGRIILDGDNTSFTLDSGHIDCSSNAVAVSNNEKLSRKIIVNGGTLSSSSNIALIRLGIVTLKEAATVSVGSEDYNAIAVHRLTIEGAPSIRGRLHYTSDTELVDLSGYTGDGLDMKFDVAYTGGDSIKLPANYGLFRNGEEITEIQSGLVATVMPRHEHRWSFEAEGAVITATCSGELNVCPVPNKTATITLKAPANRTYDGTIKTCTVEQSIDGLFDLSTGKWEYSAEPIGAGSYTAGFTYEEAEAELSFVIVAHVSPTLTLGKTEIEYSGSPAKPGATLTAELGGQTVTLVEGTDYTLNYGTETAVGSTVTVTAVPKEGGSYTFDPVSATYKIVQATPVYSTPSGLTATYGQTLAAKVALPVVADGTWSWVNGNAPVGAPGEQRHKATYTPKDSNYKGVTVELVVKVNPAPITVSSVSVQGKTYDGSDQVAVTTLGLSGIISSESVTIAELHGLKGTAPKADAGNYTEITLPKLSLTGADAANYSLVQPGKMSASFTIAPKTVTPTVEVAAGTYRYTGAAQTPAVTVKDGTTVIPATEYELSYSCNSYVGIGYATVREKAGGNYTLEEATGTFNIQPAVITITADNKSAVTGQKAPALTYTVSGLVNNEKLSKEPTVSYVSTPNMSRAGTTVIRAGGAVAPSGNYTINYVDGTLTVTKAASTGGGYGGSYGGGYTGSVSVTVDMSGVELESKTYDGQPIRFGGKASARYYTGDFTYAWYSAAGLKLNEAPVDAGDYTLRATVSRSGYTGYGSKNVTIRKAQLTVTADNISADVGDAVPELTYSVKGLASGDKLKTAPKLNYEAEPDMTKSGETTILVSGAEAPDSRNYEKTIKYVEGTLTVGEDIAVKGEETKKPVDSAKPAEPIRKLEISVGSVDRELEKQLADKNSAYYELALQESSDGGHSWTSAGEELPEGGVKVSLPLPEGSDESCSFRVIHADGEYPATVTKHEDGRYYLDFMATSLAPVAVGWTAPGEEGGFPWWILLALLGVGGVGGGFALWNRRRRY